MPDIGEETRLYQYALEYARTAADRGETEETDQAEVDDATTAVEIAWLRHLETR